MAILPIRVFGDPVLKAGTQPVVEFGEALAAIVEDMLETMYQAPGVGLAAPQVGIEKAMFVYDIGEGPGVLCNPVVEMSEGAHSRDEGCLSVPGLWFEVTRPERVVVKGQDVDGEAVEIYGEGLMARMLMHETDHLNGELLIDRLEKPARKAALKEIRERSEIGAFARRTPDAERK